ncbi:collagenase 3-like isoform X1 [Ranitomeya imitator]|uniref:collagenase 3-like isoform X1 n=1 Tax=Ranitomeya imitator TaxID=111125 RepID=UPI0037E7B6ED
MGLQWFFIPCLLVKLRIVELVPVTEGGHEGVGITKTDLIKAQEYIERFYNAFPVSRRLADPMEEKIKAMQDFFGLNITGKINKETLQVMKKPRCGVPDVQRFSHFPGKPKWQKTSLTYRVVNYTPDITDSEVDYAIAQALGLWSEVTPLNFRQIYTGEGDIMISFGYKDHGDFFPFDGPLGILAHAFSPSNGIGGDTHFDEDETWTLGHQGVNMFLVALHELGHALGLEHSRYEQAIMYPTLSDNAFVDPTKFKLFKDDVAGIQALYGPRYPNEPKSTMKPQPKPPKEPPLKPPKEPQPKPPKDPPAKPPKEPKPKPPKKPQPKPPKEPQPKPPKEPQPKPPKEPTPKPPKKPPPKPPKEPTPKPPKQPQPKPPKEPQPKPTKKPQPMPPKKPGPKPTNKPRPTWKQEAKPKPTKESKPADVPKNPTDPRKCGKDLKFDAITSMRGDLLFFKEGIIWKKSGPKTKIDTILLSDTWPKLQNIDAAYEVPERDIVYLFKGRHFWITRGFSLVRDYPQDISQFGFPNSVKSIDAALFLKEERKAIFFVQDKYWSYDHVSLKMDPKSPRKIKKGFPGIGKRVEAAFQDNDHLYFSNGANQIEYNPRRNRVVRKIPNYQKLNCK